MFCAYTTYIQWSKYHFAILPKLDDTSYIFELVYCSSCSELSSTSPLKYPENGITQT
jgi:hypothetical protein